MIVTVLVLVTLQSVAVTVVDWPAVPCIVPVVPLIVSTDGLATLNVTMLATSTPDDPPTVAFASRVTTVPAEPLVGTALIVRLLTAGHTVTVAVVVAVTDPSLALMVLEPTVVTLDDAVTIPLVCPIAATDASDELQTDLLVTFSELPSLNVPVATI